ncbi:MAG: DUF2723 domain-containing protein [Candidatus Coatesbacteria bacterium]|nr:DUF2723 domain-containing protein [Candidatus Coatesbacteria bacterium]
MNFEVYHTDKSLMNFLLGKQKKDQIFDFVLIFFIGMLLIIVSPKSLTFEDCAELALSAQTLGISHPPGYHLWVLLANFWHRIFQNRTILTSTLFSIAMFMMALFFISSFLKRYKMKVNYRLMTLLLVTSIPEVFDQSSITEVYSLNLLFIIILVYLLWTPRPNFYSFLIAFYLLGLGTGAHQTVLLFFPFALWAAFLSPYRNRLKFWSLISFMFLLGISLHLYFPLISINKGTILWGMPDNSTRFMQLIKRTPYQDTPFTWSIPAWIKMLKYLIIYSAKQLGPVVLLLILPAARLAGKHRKSLFMLPAFLWGPLLALYINFEPPAVSRFINGVFFIPFLVYIACLCPFVVREISKKWTMFAIIGLYTWSLFLIGVNVYKSLPLRYPLAVKYAKDTGRSLNFRGTYIMYAYGSQSSFPLYYLQKREFFRPDVNILDSSGYFLQSEYYGPKSKKGRSQLLKDYLVFRDFKDTGISLSYPHNLPGIVYRISGFVYQPFMTSGADPFIFINPPPAVDTNDFTFCNIRANYHFYKGMSYIQKGNETKGREHIELSFDTGLEADYLRYYYAKYKMERNELKDFEALVRKGLEIMPSSDRLYKLILSFHLQNDNKSAFKEWVWRAKQAYLNRTPSWLTAAESIANSENTQLLDMIKYLYMLEAYNKIANILDEIDRRLTPYQKQAIAADKLLIYLYIHDLNSAKLLINSYPLENIEDERIRELFKLYKSWYKMAEESELQIKTNK